METRKPKRPDCNSCYHFSKSDFNETEGYCKIRKEHLNPHEGEECEQFEPHSLYCDTDSFVEDCPFRGNDEQYCPYYDKYCECEKEEQEVCDLFSAYKDKMAKLLDTRAIKPEKYAELREQDFDTWLDTILHEIIEQVNFDASEVDALGGAVWNGECPDGTPYPKQCAREDAYIQCIRQSNQLDAFNAKLELLGDRVDALKDFFDDLEAQINDLSLRFDEFKKFIFYPCIPAQTSTATEQDLLKLLQLLQQQRTPTQISGEAEHTCSNFCGNCTHVNKCRAEDGIYACELSGEIVDPDDSSCAMFEHPF